MEIIRKGFDTFYDIIKHPVFLATQHDPEIAHELFIGFCRVLHKTGLDKIVLDNPTNQFDCGFQISPAAGLNKDGKIHPQTIRYLGFDRSVIGTVTGEYCEGNPRPRIKRYPSTESIVNWKGLPGEGAKRIRQRLEGYGEHTVPLTINLMATPGKIKDDALRDLETTMGELRKIPKVDRFELNISCPNTRNPDGSLDARDEYQRQAGDMMGLVYSLLLPEQELDVKLSPDMNLNDIEHITPVLVKQKVKRIVIGNSTTNHNPNYIPDSPGKGGASGNAVYEDSLRTQKKFYEIIKKDNLPLEIIACGGINSPERVEQRLKYGSKEIQMLTTLIFSGYSLLKTIREYYKPAA